jgi:hypothetical protein
MKRQSVNLLVNLTLPQQTIAVRTIVANIRGAKNVSPEKLKRERFQGASHIARLKRQALWIDHMPTELIATLNIG